MRLLINHSISGAADFIAMARRAHPRLYVIATHERDDTPIAREADVFLSEPVERRNLNALQYANWLVGVATAHRANLVMPYRRREDLAEHRQVFEDVDVRLLVASTAANMHLIEKKPAFLDYMAGLGVPVTPFLLFDNLQSYDALCKQREIFPEHPGPICAKPARGIYGAGFRIIRDDTGGACRWDSPTASIASTSTFELSRRAYRALLESFPVSQPMMLMPYFQGVERSVDFACLDGRLLGTVTRVKQGTCQQLSHDDQSEKMALLIAKSFNLSGMLNLQTIEDTRGVQRLMEVNTRLSGGIGMTALTNVNLPGLLFHALSGETTHLIAKVEREVRVGRREIFWEI